MISNPVFDHISSIILCGDIQQRQRQYEREKQWIYAFVPPAQYDAALRLLTKRLEV